MSSPSVAAFAIIFGLSGQGKSTEMGATFPNAKVVCRPGAMQSAASFLGIAVTEVHVRTLEQAIDLIVPAKDEGHDAVVIDDLSLLAESTERDINLILKQQPRPNKYAKYDYLNGLVATAREAGRYAGIHFAASAHERPPGTDAKGAPRPGGPRLPSWNMADSIVHEASLVLRATCDPSRSGPWKGVYDCAHESNWVGKDRLTAAASRSPQNLRAILTAGGYRLSRAPGLEWQDEVVAAIEAYSAEGQSPADIVTTLWSKLTVQGGLDPRHVAWALRDGLATLELRGLTANRFRQLFDFTPPNAPVGFGTT